MHEELQIRKFISKMQVDMQKYLICKIIYTVAKMEISIKLLNTDYTRTD